jgi:hypothetical protein
MKLSVNTTEIEHFEQLMREAPELLDAWLARADAGAVAQLEAAVKLGTPSCYGTLVNSIFGAPADAPLHGGIVGVSPPADVYGAAVEYGTRPHFPPPSALVLWVKKKFALKGAAVSAKTLKVMRYVTAELLARGKGRSAKAQKRKVGEAAAIMSAAWAVARAISKRGTPGAHMFERAIESEQANIQAIYGVAVDSAFGELQTGL